MGKFIDMTGQKFGKLTVLEMHPERDQLHIQWRCLCDCGNEKTIRGVSLRNDLTRSCGCLYNRPATEDPKFIDLTGQRFNRLTVESYSHQGEDRKSYWHVACDCGTKKVVAGPCLRSGNTGSCGCYHRDMASEANRLHGLSHKHPLWRRYMNMKDRCHNSECPHFKHYGGRGIKVCDRWLEPNGQGFLNFIEDLGMPPTNSYTIDRIDVNGNYEPSNVRWATMKVQARNKRNTRYVKFNGTTLPLKDACEYYGIDYYLAYSLIFREGGEAQPVIEQMIRAKEKPKPKPAWAV